MQKQTTFLEDPYSILIRLRHFVYVQTGKDLLRTFIVKDNNIQFCCPIHKNGMERKPSCGMSTKDKKLSDGTIIPFGTIHCFTCGYTATLPEMISHILEKEDGGLFGTKWLVQNFTSVQIENRRELELDFSRQQKEQLHHYISEEELDLYRFYHPYMYKRGLTDDLIDYFDVGYDPKFQLKKDSKPFPCITFPVRDLSGNTLFIARRAIDFKLYHYPENVKKPLYGIYEVKDFKKLYICESILNAITLTKYGQNAIALLGTGTKEQYEEINKLPCRQLITAFDGDDAGRKATARFKKAIPNKLIKVLEMPENKDINDLSYEQFKNLREFF